MNLIESAIHERIRTNSSTISCLEIICESGNVDPHIADALMGIATHMRSTNSDLARLFRAVFEDDFGEIDTSEIFG